MSHGSESSAYGLWSLVVINSAVFILFAFSFFKPRTRHDWRTLGSFSAFVVALFIEMYGFPLTLYLLSGWLAKTFPGVDLLTHDAGHLWFRALGFEGNPHFHPIHILSNVLIVVGFVLLSSAWPVLYRAQLAGVLAERGPYAYIRHPQYVAFILIMAGFLIQWPTLVTLLMFPVLSIAYGRLALREEQAVADRLGTIWHEYARRTPRWLPRFHQ